MQDLCSREHLIGASLKKHFTYVGSKCAHICASRNMSDGGWVKGGTRVERSLINQSE